MEKIKRLYPAQFRNYIKECCVYLRNFVFCGEYNMDIEYVSEPPTSKYHSGVAAASIRIDTTYLNFTITISDVVYNAYKQEDFDSVRSILVHEFCHLLTEPIYNIAVNSITNTSIEFLEQTRERQTQRITNLLIPRIPLEIFHKKSSKRKQLIS